MRITFKSGEVIDYGMNRFERADPFITIRPMDNYGTGSAAEPISIINMECIERIDFDPSIIQVRPPNPVAAATETP